MYISLIKLFLIFIIISFLGYILEVIVCSYNYKKLVNRGFFFGPYCPIYGLGGIIIIWCLNRYYEDPIVVFIMGTVLTSLIEYYTSYVLEKIFHNRWWDYSNRPDNINGRICIGNSIFFGVGSLVIVYWLYPAILSLFNLFTDKTLIIIGSILLFIFLLDVIASFVIAYNLRHRIIIAEELKAEKLKRIPIIINKKYKEEIEKLKIVSNRLIKAFPNISKNNEEELDIIWKFRKNLKESKKNKKAK